MSVNYELPPALAEKVRKSQRPKYVYFARVGDYLKVGCSYNPQQRVKQIRHGCAQPADLDPFAPTELIRAVPAGRGHHGFNVEGDYHGVLYAFGFHVEGEWFRATPEVIRWVDGLDPERSAWDQAPIEGAVSIL